MKAAKICGYGTAGLLLLYVLSVGPVYYGNARSVHHYYHVELGQPGSLERINAQADLFLAAYAPLYWCADRIPAVDRALRWYTSQWAPTAGEAIPF